MKRPSPKRRYDTRPFEISSRTPVTFSCVSAGKSPPGFAGSTARTAVGAAHDWYIHASCSIGAAE
ncbi:MAG: hypothetical protein DMD65_04555 [Gemmatimonadetes bacterium]|nr:MAG: hypothetical protein DMD65_04555 [Gemmatimonadota bacterium]